MDLIRVGRRLLPRMSLPFDNNTTQQKALVASQKPVIHQRRREVTSTCPPDKLEAEQRFCSAGRVTADRWELWGF